MTQESFKRKLTTIFSADAVGYSRLMGDDEAATVLTLKSYRALISSLIHQYNGVVIDSPGDNLLAEFTSVVDAVECAAVVQNEVAAKNDELPDHRRMLFRIGINLGDIIQDDERLYGDGVNLAARLEGIAEPGGVCISRTVFDHVENKLPYGYEFLGEQNVKNIAKPVGAYRVLIKPEATIKGKTKSSKPVSSKRKLIIGAIIGGIALIAIVGLWPFSERFINLEPTLEKNPTEMLTDKPSIAVLPFANMSGEAEQEYFCDGITEDLITDLSKISGLLVIARNSTFTYKGKAVNIKEVAQELGVRFVLEGSVRKAGKKVRITAQLIDGGTGHHLWAERYDGQLKDIFSLQDSVTKSIISSLKLELTLSEREKLVHRETENIQAYETFLKGWEYYRKDTLEDWAKAIDYFENAAELDPDYTKPYAALALIYSRYGNTSRSFESRSPLGVNTDEARVRARLNIELAMIKPTSLSYRIRALLTLFRRQYREAIDNAEQALSISPNDVDGLYTLAYILLAFGNSEEAVQLVNKGFRLDPHNISYPLYLLGLNHFVRGELNETVAMIERALEHNPKLPRPVPILPAAYALLGYKQKAKQSLNDFKKAWGPGMYNLEWQMMGIPFNNPEVVDRLTNGLLEAGLPGKPSGYYHIFDEFQLTSEEIKALVFNRKITGTTYMGNQWWEERTLDGKLIYTVPPNSAFDHNDTGTSWVESDLLCNHLKTHMYGMKYCMTVFRNPEGKPYRNNEFLAVSDFLVHPFSPVD